MDNFILHITSGRGPAECAMAVSLTLKQVLKEAEEKGIMAELLERVPGQENRTLLSATLNIHGKQARAFCQSWQGVLLWICQSPFRKFQRRKNWFIALHMADPGSFPAWNEHHITYTTMRAGGPGGQHVNKVESAVRAIHTPSGLMVMVSESRSQIQNKKLATERLKQRFDQWQIQQALGQQQALWNQHNTLERGNPTRVYEGLTFERK